MATLDDTLNLAIRKGFYTKNNNPKKYIKFTKFGSQNCIVDIYSSKGHLTVENQYLRIDSQEERQKYELISKDKLPEKLRNK